VNVLVLVNVHEQGLRLSGYFVCFSVSIQRISVYEHEHVNVEHNTANKPNINLSLFCIAPPARDQGNQHRFDL